MLEGGPGFRGTLHGEAVQKLGGHRRQRLLRPWQVPVDGAARDEARELHRHTGGQAGRDEERGCVGREVRQAREVGKAGGEAAHTARLHGCGCPAQLSRPLRLPLAGQAAATGSE